MRRLPIPPALEMDMTVTMPMPTIMTPVCTTPIHDTPTIPPKIVTSTNSAVMHQATSV